MPATEEVIALCSPVIVLSKVDQLDDAELEAKIIAFETAFPNRQIRAVSALGDIGLVELTRELMRALSEDARRRTEEPAYDEACRALEHQISMDVLAHSEAERQARQAAKAARADDDDDEAEVVYVRE